MGEPNSNYYDKGSREVATETALTVRKLEQRRKLTRNSERLVIVLVGLPGRGKSFVARKLCSFLTWRGIGCKIFNVGKYRREAHAALVADDIDSESENKREATGACDANFFDSQNVQAAKLREAVAAAAMQDMLKWLDNEEDETCKELIRTESEKYRKEHRTAIFDATNSTKARRKWILEEITGPARASKPTGVVFVESICDDEELLEQNFRSKVLNSPDYKDMGEEEAMDDLRKRVKKYEEQYQTIKDDHLSYIKIYNLSSKILVNHIYGRMAKVIVPALMAWNIGTRPIFIARAGQCDNENGVSMGNGSTTTLDTVTNPSMRPRRVVRGNHLSTAGQHFRDALCQFFVSETTEFMRKRAQFCSPPSLVTGTSISGLMGPGSELGSDGKELPLPCHIMTSTMPRAVQTATWEFLPYPVDELSSLNPLDKGDYSGMELEEIREVDPEWYAKLEQDPFRTRFPGGECYGDLINRLESCIIDMEQQVAPVVVVSHVSVLQVLIAYLSQSSVEKCTSIEVPMHTVLKFTPVRGGGWMETQHRLTPDDDISSRGSDSDLSSVTEDVKSPTPIWGDHTVSRKEA